jgi:hypothetical protein
LTFWKLYHTSLCKLHHKLSISWFSNENRAKIRSFIICTFQALISCIENTFDTWIYWKMQNQCDIHLFISLYFIRQHIYMCVKRLFNTWYSCVKCTNLWMDKIFTINSSHAKFVISNVIGLCFVGISVGMGQKPIVENSTTQGP